MPVPGHAASVEPYFDAIELARRGARLALEYDDKGVGLPIDEGPANQLLELAEQAGVDVLFALAHVAGAAVLALAEEWKLDEQAVLARLAEGIDEAIKEEDEER